MKNRQSAIAIATRAATIGLILGTLGRQGSPQVLEVGPSKNLCCNCCCCGSGGRFSSSSSCSGGDGDGGCGSSSGM